MRPLNSDIAGQESVGTADPGMRGPIEQGIEMDHLHERVNAGIGTTSANGGDALLGKFSQRRLELVLHSAARSLTLPALVRLTVVADS